MNKGCVISLVLVLLLLTAGLGAYFMSGSEDGNENVETTKATIGDIAQKAVATGAVKPRKEVIIKPQVSGVVEKLFVEPGGFIKKGEKLARIKLVPSQININNAQSGVELARIRFKQSERELERQKSVFSKKLDVESAKVAFENAQREEKRQKQLFSEGIISQIEYNDFKVDLELQKAALENAKILSTNNLKQFESEVDIRRQELEFAISNLQLLKKGATNNSKQVSNLVVSTVDGMVLEVPVEEGYSVIERNNFNEGTTIASVADMNSLIFEGMVDESDVGKLKEGLGLEMTVGAVEDAKFTATLEYISPKGVEEEGTVKFEIRAAIDQNPDVFLRAGYSASADIILDRRKQVLTINERDLISKKDSNYVEVKVGEDQFEKRLVEIGLADGILVEIKSGLDTMTEIKVITIAE